MSCLFEGFKKVNTIVGMENLDTSQAEYLNQLFEECYSLTSIDVSHFNTSKAKTMEGMFSYCEKLTSLDISGFDTSNVTDMNEMFNGCSSITQLNISNFNTAKVTDMSRMFRLCESLQALDCSTFNTAKVTDMSYMFFECSSLKSLNVSSFDTSKVTDMDRMFCCYDLNYNLYGNELLDAIDVSNFNTSNVTNMRQMFSGMEKVTALNTSNFNTSKVTDMSRMFDDCESLIDLDVSNFDTSAVTDMSHMFASCSSLTNLDVSRFDTSKVTDMRYMFQYCKMPLLDLHHWNTSQVTNMALMFDGCSKLTSLDLSSFDTSKVTDMSAMFSDCSSLSDINIKKFNTSKVTDMSAMFMDCESIQSLDLSNFDTSKVTDMSAMFFLQGKRSLRYLNLSSFDTTNVLKHWQKLINERKDWINRPFDSGCDDMFGYLNSDQPFTVVLGQKCFTADGIKDGCIYKQGIQYSLPRIYNSNNYVIYKQEDKNQIFDYKYTRDSNKQYDKYSYDSSFANSWVPEMAGTWIIKAKDTPVPTQYTVTFKDGLMNQTISSRKVNAGGSINIPTAPVHDGYEFVKWQNKDKLTNIQSDVIVTAIYKKIEKPVMKYTVIFKDGLVNTVISSSVVEGGTNVSVPTAPMHDGYEFVKWQNKHKLTNIQSDVIVTAIYKKIEKPATKYTVIFKDGLANTVISSSVVEEGANVSVPTAPEHDGYEFVSWDNEEKLTNIQSDVTVIATYKKIEKPDNQSKQTVLPIKSDDNNQTISNQPNELEQTGISLPSLLVPLSAILSVVLIAYYRRRSK